MIAYSCYVMDVCVVVSFCACNLTLTEKDVEIDKSESQCVVCRTNVKMLERLGWEIHSHSRHIYTSKSFWPEYLISAGF
jgi:hypothetical protein